MWDMRRIYGGDPEGKLSMLMDWAGQKGRLGCSVHSGDHTPRKPGGHPDFSVDKPNPPVYNPEQQRS